MVYFITIWKKVLFRPRVSSHSVLPTVRSLMKSRYAIPTRVPLLATSPSLAFRFDAQARRLEQQVCGGTQKNVYNWYKVLHKCSIHTLQPRKPGCWSPPSAIEWRVSLRCYSSSFNKSFAEEQDEELAQVRWPRDFSFVSTNPSSMTRPSPSSSHIGDDMVVDEDRRDGTRDSCDIDTT